MIEAIRIKSVVLYGMVERGTSAQRRVDIERMMMEAYEYGRATGYQEAARDREATVTSDFLEGMKSSAHLALTPHRLVELLRKCVPLMHAEHLRKLAASEQSVLLFNPSMVIEELVRALEQQTRIVDG